MPLVTTVNRLFLWWIPIFSNVGPLGNT